jgi:hypothetical protein
MWCTILIFSNFKFPMLDTIPIRCRGFMIIATLPTIVFAQGGGRFEESKRLALAYMESNQYDRAAGKLEEIWEQNQSDPDVAEWLAVAYLNGQDRDSQSGVETKSLALMEQSLRLGGKATLLVQHSHERLGWLQGHTINNYCSGKLSVSPGRLVFIAVARRGLEEHSFDFPADEVRISGPSQDDMGAFQIKTKSKTYSLIPRTRNRKDSELFVSLLQQQLRGK